MRLLIIGDVQAWDYRQFNWMESNDHSSRVNRLIDFLSDMEHIISQKHIDQVIFLGDLVNKPNVSPEILNILRNTFNGRGEQFHIVLGNHDTPYDWQGEKEETLDDIYLTFLESVNVSVYPKPEEVSFGGKTAWLVPYTEKPVKIFKIKEDLLFAHIPVKGMLEFESHKEQQNAITREELRKNFKTMFFGHYHEPMIDPPFYFMGASMQNTFSDKESKRYMAVYDTENSKTELIEYETKNRMITLNQSPDVLPEPDKHYYRIYYDILTEIPKFQKNILWVPKTQNIEKTEHNDEEFRFLHIESFLKEFVNLYPGALPKEYLIDIGLEILAKAKECEY